MVRFGTSVVVLLMLARPAGAQVAIAGSSVAKWQACTTWTTNPATDYDVTDRDGSLVFTAEGAGTEMPWLLKLNGLGVTSDERYVLVRYRAKGLVATRGNYFLHGQEGTVGGRAYALADQLEPDEVRQFGKGMRWLLPLPEPVDLATTPHLSARYRATGHLSGSAYAIWLGDRQSGTGGSATIPLFAKDLQTDGAWHNVCVKIAKPFTATHLAVGLDCAADTAALTLATMRFSAHPRRWTIQEALPHRTRADPWQTGRDGFVTARLVGGETISDFKRSGMILLVEGGKPSPFFGQRLALTDWFDSPHVTVEGVPFEVSTDLEQVPQTGMGGFGTVSLELPPGVPEVYLLAAASAPATEPWGIDWKHPKPQEIWFIRTMRTWQFLRV